MFDKQFQEIVQICAKLDKRFVKYFKEMKRLIPKSIQESREDAEYTDRSKTAHFKAESKNDFFIDVDTKNDQSYDIYYHVFSMEELKNLPKSTITPDRVDKPAVKDTGLFEVFSLAYADEDDNTMDFVFQIARVEDEYYLVTEVYKNVACRVDVKTVKLTDAQLEIFGHADPEDANEIQ